MEKGGFLSKLVLMALVMLGGSIELLGITYGYAVSSSSSLCM